MLFCCGCRCKTWLINCGRADIDAQFQLDPLFPSRNCWLCSDHFEPCQFVSKDNSRLIVNPSRSRLLYMNAGTFVLKTIRSLEHSFLRPFAGPFVPETNKHCRPFHPRTIRSLDRSFPGTFRKGNVKCPSST